MSSLRACPRGNKTHAFLHCARVDGQDGENFVMTSPGLHRVRGYSKDTAVLMNSHPCLAAAVEYTYLSVALGSICNTMRSLASCEPVAEGLSRTTRSRNTGVRAAYAPSCRRGRVRADISYERSNKRPDLVAASAQGDQPRRFLLSTISLTKVLFTLRVV